MTEPRSIIRGYRQLEAKIGYGRWAIWRKMQTGEFPAAIELGSNGVGWFEDEIDAWLASRPRRNYRAPQRSAPQGKDMIEAPAK